jgi:Domain of unknown function (DUF4432)
VQNVPPVSLFDDGYLPRLETVSKVSQVKLDGGPADGMRVIDVSMQGGLAFRVLPDRGFDIGSAWSHGLPIGWESIRGDRPPVVANTNDQWIDGFSGGLLVTCGPDNIGLPSFDDGDELGLHGSWSSLRAEVVSVERELIDDGNVEVCLVGSMQQVTTAGRRIEIRRTIRTQTNKSVVSIVDVLTNRGSQTAPIPLLYHVNLGAPLWAPGTELGYPDGTTTVPRTPYAAEKLSVSSVGPEVERNAEEYVFERVLPEETNAVTVTNRSLGLMVSLSWTRDSLPRFHQWIQPAFGTYALGIEPSNASLAGRNVDRQAGRLPELQPGESRSFGITVLVNSLTP